MGPVRLLSGMVLANRPWKLLPSFKGTLAAAFAAGALALVVTTLWILADSVGWPRLLLLMLTVIVAMVVWVILAHHLWEHLSAAVLFAYVVLFALNFVAAWVFVPGAYFQTILKLWQGDRQDAQGEVEGSAVFRSLEFSDCLPMGAWGSRIVHTVNRSESYPGRIS